MSQKKKKKKGVTKCSLIGPHLKFTPFYLTTEAAEVFYGRALSLIGILRHNQLAGLLFHMHWCLF